MERSGLYLGDIRKVNKTYIRTKNKIYEVLEERDIYYEISHNIETGEQISKDYSKCINPPKQYITKNGIFYEDDIICKSNTLEELCDVIVETKGHTGEWVHYQYTSFNEPTKKALVNDIIEQDFEVYYAIWTDKGLIYVA